MAKSKDIQDWLRARIADRLRLSPSEVDPDATFDRYNFSSLVAVELAGDLEDWLSTSISPLCFYEYPTIAQLADHLADPEARRAV